ncbi:shikimate 5-dehydrogenase [Rouxiella chamberiensis]|uniref:shikimate 5-dehydrogenase n=1 Tax=Rouxiella chamberiensis TaxID=1513468 RepID=UPI0005D4327A|nr:shikimate 5-dehydrogenase [Rouxiella chamberiensis]
MTNHLNKDTTVCMSLAARPSNFGTRFHNYLYNALDLDYLYKAFTTQDLNGAITGVRALGIRGCAISMPFKEECIPMLDELDASAKAINSVNTIVNTDGYLKAYNTDYIAIATLLKQYKVSSTLTFALRGSGGMAKAVACALKDAGFTQGYIIAKNEKTGPELANLYGFEWRKELDDIKPDLLINATPIGMAAGADADKLSFSEQQIRDAQVIFEVVALPAETPLLKFAKSQNKTVITGSEVFAIQAVEQFVLYTGVRPDDALFQQAAKYAREGV